MKYILILFTIIVFFLIWKFKRKSNDIQEIEYQPSFVSYKEKRTLDEVFSNLKSFYNENYPKISGSLNPPATDADLNNLEKLVKIKLPEEFRNLYKIANGQKEINQPFFQNGYDFMPIENISMNWKTLKKLEESDEGKHYEEEDITGVIIDTWWKPEWIPFGNMGNGDLLCLDLNPGEKGIKGQIIEFIHDDYIREHKGQSINDFLGELSFGLKNKKYFMHKEYEIITSDE